MRFAKFAGVEQRDTFYAKAAQHLEKTCDCDPNRAEYRYLLADVLYKMENDASSVKADREARRALRLDEQNPRGVRKLTDLQRQELQTRLAKAGEKP
jgi:hypothetical protein